MSRLGAKTYSRRSDCKTSLHFDHLLAEKGNKPSTAKVSVAAIHRWGMTSFTSLRKAHLNGQKDISSDSAESGKRFKKDAKTFVSHKDPFGFEPDVDTSGGHKDFSCHSAKFVAARPKKFFKSSESSVKTSLTGSDSAKKINVESLKLSVFQNCGFAKQEEIGRCESRKLSRSGEVCDLEHKLPQGLGCSGTAAVSVTLDQQKPVTNCEMLCDESMFSGGGGNHLLCTGTEASEYNVNLHCEEDKGVTDGVISESTRAMPDNLPSTGVACDNLRTICLQEKNENCDISEPCIAKKGTEVSVCEPGDTVLDCFQESDTTCGSDPSSGVSSSLEPCEKIQGMKVKNAFRSKKIFNSSKKPKAVYNHRHWQSLKEDSTVAHSEHSEIDVETAVRSVCLKRNDELLENTVKTEIQHYSDEDIASSATVTKPPEQLYTVVRNVKQAYQCHESGEAQEFNDDIEYLLEGLQSCNGVGTRCLSILGLATKCMGPAFRIHLRAHGTMPKIFSALQDAPSDPNLSLCVATLLFVLSQDRLTMDIDASTLSMMLQLLETDAETESSEKDFDLILEDPALCAMQEKHREKVFQLCEQMQQKGHAKHLKLSSVNASILAMETLLSLTSRKAGEWFKEEMRLLHGLDRVIDTVASCVDSLNFEQNEKPLHPNEIQLDKLQRTDRCLRVLENVTYMNKENQDYLLSYRRSILSNCCLSLMKLCKSCLLNAQAVDADIAFNGSTRNILSPILFCLLSVMKVLLNITFENASACAYIGAERGLMENVLICIFQVPRAVPSEKRFDLLVLSLGLMINLVEHCCENRKRFMETFSFGSYEGVNDGHRILASEALVEVLHCRLEAARQNEEQADELLSSTDVSSTEKKDSDIAPTQAECLEETLMKTLQKAGKHMEHSIIAAYISLLLGCVIQDNQEYTNIIRDHMPDGRFDVMVDVLKKFMSFVSLTGSVGSTGVKSIQRIIEVFGACS